MPIPSSSVGAVAPSPSSMVSQSKPVSVKDIANLFNGVSKSVSYAKTNNEANSIVKSNDSSTQGLHPPRLNNSNVTAKFNSQSGPVPKNVAGLIAKEFTQKEMSSLLKPSSQGGATSLKSDRSITHDKTPPTPPMKPPRVMAEFGNRNINAVSDLSHSHSSVTHDKTPPTPPPKPPIVEAKYDTPPKNRASEQSYSDSSIYNYGTPPSLPSRSYKLEVDDIYIGQDASTGDLEPEYEEIHDTTFAVQRENPNEPERKQIWVPSIQQYIPPPPLGPVPQPNLNRQKDDAGIKEAPPRPPRSFEKEAAEAKTKLGSNQQPNQSTTSGLYKIDDNFVSKSAQAVETNTWTDEIDNESDFYETV